MSYDDLVGKWAELMEKLPVFMGSPPSEPQIKGLGMWLNAFLTRSVQPALARGDVKEVDRNMDEVWQVLKRVVGDDMFWSKGGGIVHSAWHEIGVYTNTPVTPLATWAEMCQRMKEEGIRHLIDVGAGRGLFTANLMAQMHSRGRSLQVVAVDTRRISDAFLPHVYYLKEKNVVEKMKCWWQRQRLRLPTSSSTFVLCLLWPFPNCSMAYDTLSIYPGTHLIFAGQLASFPSYSSATGTTSFHQQLHSHWKCQHSWPLHSTSLVPSTLYWFKRR